MRTNAGLAADADVAGVLASAVINSTTDNKRKKYMKGVTVLLRFNVTPPKKFSLNALSKYTTLLHN